MRDKEYYFSIENDLEKQTIGEMPKLWAEKYGEKIAVISGENEISYKEMYERSEKLYNGLRKLGIRKGEHVVVQLPNTDSFVYVLFALEKIGALPVMTLPAHRKNDLEEIFRTVQPVAYIVAESYLGYAYEEMATYMKKNIGSLKYVICDGGMAGAIELETLFSNEKAEAAEGPTYNDIAHLLLSGGTTGTPKLIPRGQAEYLYNAKKAAERCRITSDDVLLITVPVSHNFSLSAFGILGAFINGATVVMCLYPSSDAMLPLIEEYDVTALQLVPALVSALMETLSWDDSYDIDSLRLIVVGGAVFEKELALKVEPTLNCKLVQVFGTAEGIICMTSLDDSYEVSASCQGKAISEYDEIRIIDENGNDLPQGSVGEFIEYGPYTIDGYYMAKPGVNESAFTEDGYYRTGDKAKIDKNGNLVVLGRIKEQINKGGEKIMPSEVEEMICKADYVKEAAVVGARDEVTGSRICAFIIAEKDVSIAEMRSFLKELGMPDYKMPDEITFVNAFPLTKLGKVDKNALQKLAESK